LCEFFADDDNGCNDTDGSRRRSSLPASRDFPLAKTRSTIVMARCSVDVSNKKCSDSSINQSINIDLIFGVNCGCTDINAVLSHGWYELLSLFQSSFKTKSLCFSFGVTFDMVEDNDKEVDDDEEEECGDPNGIPYLLLLRLLLGLDKFLALSDIDGS